MVVVEFLPLHPRQGDVGGGEGRFSPLQILSLFNIGLKHCAR